VNCGPKTVHAKMYEITVGPTVDITQSVVNRRFKHVRVPAESLKSTTLYSGDYGMLALPARSANSVLGATILFLRLPNHRGNKHQLLITSYDSIAVVSIPSFFRPPSPFTTSACMKVDSGEVALICVEGILTCTQHL
jgi:hypothetical protein